MPTNDDLLNALLHEVENDCGNGADTYSERVMQARAAVLARMVPDGWVAVPLPPTEEMRRAGWETLKAKNDFQVRLGNSLAGVETPVFESMVRAAPPVSP